MFFMEPAQNHPEHFERIDVSKNESQQFWLGIPVIHKITENLMATLTPQSQDGTVNLLLSVYDCSDPTDLIRVGCCPLA